MKKRNILLMICILFSTLLLGQSFQIGMNFGMSKLQHNTRFETTPLHNLYSFVAISHLPYRYTWNEFEKQYKLQESIIQPRFGITVDITFDNAPIIISGELMTSTSTYMKPMIGLSGGIGDKFYSYDEQMFFTLYSGYKFVHDRGFGAKTLVNSIGLKEARDLAITFFGPEHALGTNQGHLLFLRAGFGKDIGPFTIGLEGYGELDLTDKLKRESRMTNIGINFYTKFRIE